MRESGFIAIVSVVIIAAILMAISLALSMSGFFARANIGDAEYYDRAVTVAEGCADDSLIAMESGTPYAGSCPLTVSTSGTQKTIQTTAMIQSAVANIQVTVNATTLAIISWEQVPHF